MPKRLADETCPHLLQHAKNPVDWWPWGPQAVAEAERSDRPVLLSIGNAACHWCHVISYVSASVRRRRVHAQIMLFQRDHRSNLMLRSAGSSV